MASVTIADIDNLTSPSPTCSHTENSRWHSKSMRNACALTGGEVEMLIGLPLLRCDVTIYNSWQKLGKILMFDDLSIYELRCTGVFLL